MQTLIFNTEKKEIILYQGSRIDGKIIERRDSIPTVTVEKNYYQIMRKFETGETRPIMRLPISNTNMIIER